MWDLDGCLLDSSPGIIESMILTLTEFGVPFDENELVSTIGISWSEVFRSKYAMPEAEVEKAVAYCRCRFIDEGRMLNAEIFDGIDPLLRELSKVSSPLFVVTAKPTDHAEKILKGHNLRKYFKEVHGSELTGNMTKAGMIGQIIHDHAIENPRDVIMIDDRAAGVNAAREAGVVSVGIMHGYAEDGELEAAQPDHLVADAKELWNLLLD